MFHNQLMTDHPINCFFADDHPINYSVNKLKLDWFFQFIIIYGFFFINGKYRKTRRKENYCLVK